MSRRARVRSMETVAEFSTSGDWGRSVHLTGYIMNPRHLSTTLPIPTPTSNTNSQLSLQETFQSFQQQQQVQQLLEDEQQDEMNFSADEIGRAVQQECRDRSRMPSSA
eukprot:TRINITY_DN7903_c0_g1_i2.p2 TRINITY_DN7903_c0_g1~~TRINITY_DN7903_c0_g1_i2.p2  ORF type:complete len:108 (+),score=25.82 TRINITY_DN7903_c0_g1_i2:426-749(+)